MPIVLALNNLICTNSLKKEKKRKKKKKTTSDTKIICTPKYFNHNTAPYENIFQN